MIVKTITNLKVLKLKVSVKVSINVKGSWMKLMLNLSEL